MLKGQDILLLLKLSNEADGWTIRSVGEDLGLDPASVHRALKRLQEARLLRGDGRTVDRLRAEEVLLHAVKYMFPPRQGGLSRGVPTAWAAAPLSELLVVGEEPPPVWPDPTGKARGIALEPIHRNAPKLARHDPFLAESLALLDALRIGSARERDLAARELRNRLGQPALVVQ